MVWGPDVRSKRQIAGMRGVYAVAAELSRLGFIVELGPMRGGGVDLVVGRAETPEHRNHLVKVHSHEGRARFWVVRSLVVSPRHIYVFVWFKEEETRFYFVPSRHVTRVRRARDTNLPRVYRLDVEQYRDDWEQALRE